jgi:3-hydroxymyristoyl/3-hydroxydecanoyl-(acyl carrier protein) dehydratase
MRFPAARRRETAQGQAEFELEVDPGLLGFQGHFPEDPILPGVVQVDWAIHFGREAFGPMGAFAGIRNLKFMEIIRPGEPLALRLTLDPAGIRFAFQGSQGAKSSGTLRYSQEA